MIENVQLLSHIVFFIRMSFLDNKQTDAVFVYNKRKVERMTYMETRRLYIRHIEEKDIDDFYEFASDERVGPAAGWASHKSKEESLQFLRTLATQEHQYALIYKGNQKMIGSIAIHIDKRRINPDAGLLGFVLHPLYWNRGIMPECVSCILSFAFTTLHMDIVSVCHYTDNMKSQRVIQKCGFQYEGTLRKAQILYNGEVKDLCMYSMLKNEYDEIAGMQKEKQK